MKFKEPGKQKLLRYNSWQQVKRVYSDLFQALKTQHSNSSGFSANGPHFLYPYVMLVAAVIPLHIAPHR